MGGLYFEEFEVGQIFDHAITRTVTEMDNVMFTAMTHNPAKLHLDEHYCQTETEFGQRLVNSIFTLGLVIGITVPETTLGTTVANLGMDDVRFPRPVFHGDTIHVQTEVLDNLANRHQLRVATSLVRGFDADRRMGRVVKQGNELDAILVSHRQQHRSIRFCQTDNLVDAGADRHHRQPHALSYGG